MQTLLYPWPFTDEFIRGCGFKEQGHALAYGIPHLRVKINASIDKEFFKAKNTLLGEHIARMHDASLEKAKHARRHCC